MISSDCTRDEWDSVQVLLGRSPSRNMKWANRTLDGSTEQAGQRLSLRATASNAVRIASRAGNMGQEPDGVTFIVSSEPNTEAKRTSIERVNARAGLAMDARTLAKSEIRLRQSQ